MALDWPRKGCCGACGRPAIEIPSRKWWHVGVPCQARSTDIWRIEDVFILQSVRFVPEGEPLPTEPDRWHSHVTDTLPDGFPIALGFCRADHMPSVRAALAAEAEARDALAGAS